MRVILQGSLRHFAAGELLPLLAGRGHTGTFDAESGEKRVRMLFREGRIDAAEASVGDDPQSIIADLVGWSDGTFTFLDGVEMTPGAKQLDLEIAPLLAEAERRSGEARRLLELYPDEQTVFQVVDRPSVAGDISLSPDEFQLLFQIGSGRSLAQLRSDRRRSPVEVYSIVHKLHANGLIGVAGDSTLLTARVSLNHPEPMGSIPPKTLSRKKTISQKKRPSMATLTTDDGTMYPLLEDVTTVGRTEDNIVALRDPSVSSHHARVIRSGTFGIEDLGSRNGTYVNGEKVTELRTLADGDLIRFGKLVLTFNVAALAKAQETTQPEVNAPKREDQK
ncbi:MAG: hypothetical protein JWN02_686 [Acidobacteria bacterium]|nr:hypothetical protein [Acidobacteriota bacterium]